MSETPGTEAGPVTAAWASVVEAMPYKRFRLELTGDHEFGFMARLTNWPIGKPGVEVQSYADPGWGYDAQGHDTIEEALRALAVALLSDHARADTPSREGGE